MTEPRLLKHAKALRKEMTDAERRLWYHLRGHRFVGTKFKRQKPIGPFIVDFVCMEHRLVIELDGGQHADAAGYDQRRDSWLAANGYRVLRFWNNEAMQNLPGVLERIREWLLADVAPSPAPTGHPLPQAGEGSKSAPSLPTPLPLAGEGGRRPGEGRHDSDLIERIDRLLPQTQCTRCGYPACRPYAEAIAAGMAAINQCPPGGAEGIHTLARLLGRAPLPLNPHNGVEAPRTVAFIREDECIGCTKCIQACPVDAILGAAKCMHTVIAELCTGCDLCVAPCPVDCIDLLPAPAHTARPAPPWTRDEPELPRF